MAHDQDVRGSLEKQLRDINEKLVSCSDDERHGLSTELREIERQILSTNSENRADAICGDADALEQFQRLPSVQIDGGTQKYVLIKVESIPGNSTVSNHGHTTTFPMLFRQLS
eukprot:GHVT01097225.1.p1 GENE.GHVT01097225.1~~GHVT01097225.1.p1  ORF type:complete len:113 (+),score=3.98 GHVT01097225.1:1879-2217(+)